MEEQTDVVAVKSRFGDCVINASEVIHFPNGIIGMEEHKDFALLHVDKEAPFLLLQSIEKEDVNFLLTNPLLFMNEYNFEISEEEKGLLEVHAKEDIIFLTILTVPEGFPEASHIFLLAPMIINLNGKRGVQIVNGEYEGDKATFLLNFSDSAEHTTEAHADAELTADAEAVSND